MVAKYDEEHPKTSLYGIKDYTENNLIEDMNFDIYIPQRIALGVIKNFVYSWDRCYKKISKKPKFHKYNPNKQSFYVSSTKYSLDGKRNFINFPHKKGIGKQEI